MGAARCVWGMESNNTGDSAELQAAAEPLYQPSKLGGKHLVRALLSIPVVATTVCVAYAATSGAPLDTISAMVAYNGDLEIVFGINMGVSMFSLTAAMYILKCRIIGDTEKYDNFVYYIFNITMVFGLGSLARFTLDRDPGTHILYAGIAFVSQLCMVTLTCYWAWCETKKTKTSQQPKRFSAIFIVSAVVFLCLFAASVGSRPFWFEYALLVSMWLSSMCLNEMDWNAIHASTSESRGSNIQQRSALQVTLNARPDTRFDVV